MSSGSQFMTLDEIKKVKSISKEINILKYDEKQKHMWDDFISRSKNSTFLFNRDYMEYHSNRYKDFSLMFFYNNRLIAVMPANRTNGTLYSHAGLTYGGVVSDKKMKMSLMMAIFYSLKDFLKEQRIKKLHYKAIPHIYHYLPSEEDLYALYRFKAKLIRRDVASTVFMGENVPFSRCIKSCIKNYCNNGLEIKRSYDFDKFMSIEEDVLQQKYGVKPVHTVDEIKYLASKFPENIKLFATFNNRMIAGTIIFETKNLAHAQYSASNEEGHKIGASHFLFGYLINDYYKNKRYFDFGISTERNGRFLNHGLIDFKERFGARAINYDTYEMYVT